MRYADRPNAFGCYDPQCGDSTWDHECPVVPPPGLKSGGIRQKLRYVYFVSYAYRTGFGMREISTERPVDTYRAVDQLQTAIADTDGCLPAEIIVISFQLLNAEGR